GASGATHELKIVLTVPKELEFVSGKGSEGMTFTKNGATVESSAFVLAPNEKLHVTYTMHVLSKPPVSFLKTTASIQTMNGVEIARGRGWTAIQQRERFGAPCWGGVPACGPVTPAGSPTARRSSPTPRRCSPTSPSRRTSRPCRRPASPASDARGRGR